MKNLNKKSLIIFFIIGIVILSIYLLINQRSITSTDINPLPTPKLSQYPKGKIEIVSEIREQDFNIPAKLSYVESTSAPLEKTLIDTISQNLSFIGEPNTAEDIILGNVYFFNNTDNFLTIYPKIRKLKYGPATAPYEKIISTPNKQLTDKEVLTVAEDFIQKKLLIPNNLLVLSQTRYLVADRESEVFQETTEDKGQIIQLNFSPTLARYPVLTSNPLQSMTYIQILKDGTILNAEVFYPDTYKNSSQEYSIRDYSQFNSQIFSAVLVSLDSSNINLADFTEETKGTITLQKVSLAYLFDDSYGTTYLPIFLLEGTANIDSYGENLPAVMYLPAYK